MPSDTTNDASNGATLAPVDNGDLSRGEPSETTSSEYSQPCSSVSVSAESCLQANNNPNDNGSSTSQRKRETESTALDMQAENDLGEKHDHKKMKLTEDAATASAATGSTTASSEGSPGFKHKHKAHGPSLIQQQIVPPPRSPIDLRIEALESSGAGAPSVPCRETAPMPHEPMLRLNKHEIDLSIMQPIVGIIRKQKGNKHTLFRFEDIKLLFASNEVTPVLKQWKADCFDNPLIRRELDIMLVETSSTWDKEAEEIASCAIRYTAIKARATSLSFEQSDAMMACAKFVRRLVRCLSPYIIHYLDKCKFPDMDRFVYEFAARVLLTAYQDLLNQPQGFFDILINSAFGTGITAEARPLWAKHLGLPGAKEELQQPSMRLAKAVLSFGNATESKLKSHQTSKVKKTLSITENLYEASVRFTLFHKQLQKEADYYPDLLLATSDQPATVTLPMHVPSRIASHETTCTIEPACTAKHNGTTVAQDDGAIPTAPDPDEDAPPNKLKHRHQHFCLSDGRITPSPAFTEEFPDQDPFTPREELILFKRYKAVVKVRNFDINSTNVSMAWWEQWSMVAEVLPGRGVMDCIEFFQEHREHFQL